MTTPVGGRVYRQNGVTVPEDENLTSPITGEIKHVSKFNEEEIKLYAAKPMAPRIVKSSTEEVNKAIASLMEEKKKLENS